MPLDRLVDLQWQYFADGIDVRSVWAKRITGGPIKVAVVDTGIDLRHKDLRRNVWTNPGEIAGNGVDDDRNGYVDDVHGYDVVDRDGDPTDEHGHGTHVAGILGARGNNRQGIAGVAWRVQLIAVRALDERNEGTTTSLAAGIDYAVAAGARVVNVSMNSPTDDPDVRRALAAARAADVLVVAAAGNDGLDLEQQRSYPVCTGAPNLIGVGSSTPAGTMSTFSNHGPCVDVVAPGEGIVSTRRGGGYEERSGTSMAAPQVSGAAVLLLAARPSLSADQLRAALVGGARPSLLQAVSGEAPGAGRLSVARALRRALRAVSLGIAPDSGAGSSDRVRRASPDRTRALTRNIARSRGAPR